MRATATGRAFQTALFVTRAHRLQMTVSGTPEVLAAGIIVEQIGKFLASRPARKWTRWDERSRSAEHQRLAVAWRNVDLRNRRQARLDPKDLRRRRKKTLTQSSVISVISARETKAYAKNGNYQQMPIR